MFFVCARFPSALNMALCSFGVPSESIPRGSTFPRMSCSPICFSDGIMYF